MTTSTMLHIQISLYENLFRIPRKYLKMGGENALLIMKNDAC